MSDDPIGQIRDVSVTLAAIAKTIQAAKNMVGGGKSKVDQEAVDVLGDAIITLSDGLLSSLKALAEFMDLVREDIELNDHAAERSHQGHMATLEMVSTLTARIKALEERQ